MDGEQRIEQVGQIDPVCLRDQAKELPVAIEAPWATVFEDLQPRLVMPIEQFVRNAAGCRLVRQFKSLGAKPLHAHHRYDLIR